MAKFSVVPGDKVAYSVQFLRSIGMSHSAMAHARGIVQTIQACAPRVAPSTTPPGLSSPHNSATAGAAKPEPSLTAKAD